MWATWCQCKALSNVPCNTKATFITESEGAQSQQWLGSPLITDQTKLTPATRTEIFVSFKIYMVVVVSTWVAGRLQGAQPVLMIMSGFLRILGQPVGHGTQILSSSAGLGKH